MTDQPDIKTDTENLQEMFDLLSDIIREAERRADEQAAALLQPASD
jgi:hypothetical protein